MKEYELMIGDFVQAQFMDEDENPTHVEPVRICAIDENGTLGNNGDWYFMFESLSNDEDYYDEMVSCFLGIPISEEILKANGFECDKIQDMCILLVKELSTCVEWNKTSHTLFINDGFLPKRIKYVHELQHALRLIGLNTFADNLKITEL